MKKLSTDQKHDAFMRLFLRHESRIYAYIRSCVFSEADAMDVLQEVSMVIWRKFDEYEPDTHFDRWALSIARFQIMYHQKKHKRDHLVFRHEVLTMLEEDEGGDVNWSEEVHDRLRCCLSKLADSDQRLVSLRYTEGQTGRAIAKLLGQSESFVSRGLSRINVSLMQCMQFLEEAG